MKTIILLLVLFITLISCTNENKIHYHVTDKTGTLITPIETCTQEGTHSILYKYK